MSDIAIRVENLSKRYRIGQRERYYALRDVLTNAIHAPFAALVGKELGAKCQSLCRVYLGPQGCLLHLEPEILLVDEVLAVGDTVSKRGDWNGSRKSRKK